MTAMLNRVYADYLMPSRLGEYEALVRDVAAAGYTQMSVREFFRDIHGNDRPAGNAFVHRHDIDSDLRTARKMFAIESRHGVRASYYFRLSTLDFGFMRDIEAAGSEASYHYEEVADFAKRHRLRSAEAVRQRFPEIRELFARNVSHIVERLGLPITTVASHGDFANRRLKVINHELLRDEALRRRCGIECESYDAELLRCFDIYISDRKHPVYYYPLSPFDALGKHTNICLLTHPVQWETNWFESTRLNVRRAIEEMAWRWA
ncbi:hypothetical protein SAMN05216204_10295 [Massilia yuzhufengensis]|uniref:Polysaccharide deacetylase n=2 Tax=Massilia yuzhufengensis TaxID=1164594 RepID=A0A1I1EEB1_9BURK|nr:hypothetical protein SAMN05216204_10295 [Massilia yuzhufengensis]